MICTRLYHIWITWNIWKRVGRKENQRDNGEREK